MSFKALMSGPVNLAAPRIFVGGLAVMISASAFAVQDAPPAPAEPAIDPPVVEEPDAPSDPPSLDDLLEIEGESNSGAAEAAAEAERQRSLDAALAEQEPDQAFPGWRSPRCFESVDRPSGSARSTGLGTQRAPGTDRRPPPGARSTAPGGSVNSSSSSNPAIQFKLAASSRTRAAGATGEPQDGRAGQDGRAQQGRNDGEGSGWLLDPAPSAGVRRPWKGVLDESQDRMGRLCRRGCGISSPRGCAIRCRSSIVP